MTAVNYEGVNLHILEIQIICDRLPVFCSFDRSTDFIEVAHRITQPFGSDLFGRKSPKRPASMPPVNLGQLDCPPILLIN